MKSLSRLIWLGPSAHHQAAGWLIWPDPDEFYAFASATESLWRVVSPLLRGKSWTLLFNRAWPHLGRPNRYKDAFDIFIRAWTRANKLNGHSDRLKHANMAHVRGNYITDKQTNKKCSEVDSTHESEKGTTKGAVWNNNCSLAANDKSIKVFAEPHESFHLLWTC